MASWGVVRSEVPKIFELMVDGFTEDTRENEASSEEEPKTRCWCLSGLSCMGDKWRSIDSWDYMGCVVEDKPSSFAHVLFIVFVYVFFSVYIFSWSYFHPKVCFGLYWWWIDGWWWASLRAYIFLYFWKNLERSLSLSLCLCLCLSVRLSLLAFLMFLFSPKTKLFSLFIPSFAHPCVLPLNGVRTDEFETSESLDTHTYTYLLTHLLARHSWMFLFLVSVSTKNNWRIGGRVFCRTLKIGHGGGGALLSWLHPSWLLCISRIKWGYRGT